MINPTVKDTREAMRGEFTSWPSLQLMTVWVRWTKADNKSSQHP